MKKKPKKKYRPKCSCQAALRPDGSCSAGCKPELKRPHRRVRDSVGVPEPKPESLISLRAARDGLARVDPRYAEFRAGHRNNARRAWTAPR
jgi:hypothetical protein